jgi:DHA1 family inner membrane transport protein
MSDIPITVPSRRQTISALILGSVALLILGLQPLLLGELVAHHRVSLTGIGMVAMGEIVALGLGVIVGNTFLSPVSLPGVVFMTAAPLALLDLLTARLTGDGAFGATRAFAGLLEGILVWVTTSVIVRTPTPDRLAAVFFVTQTLAQAAAAALLASVIIPITGWQGGFAMLGVVSLALLVLAPALRPGLNPLRSHGTTPPLRSPATWITFAVVLAQMSSIGALWAYLDPLGRAIGLTGPQVGVLICAVLLLQVIGGSTAAAIIRKLPAPKLLLMTSLLLAAVTATLRTPLSAPIFSALCGLFGFVWLFRMPFQVRLAFAADPTGRVAVLVPALQLLGSAFGPLLASLLVVTDDDAHAVPLVCTGFEILALGLLLAGRTLFNGSGTHSTSGEPL